MPDQWYCETTKLVPDVNINGTAYALAVRFRDPWRNRERAASMIVSGVVERVDDLGGGLRRIVCRRGWQMWSNTVAMPGGGIVEVERRSWMGGNVCDTPEPLRVYAFNNEMAARGSFGRTRALAGDTVRRAGGAGGRRWIAREATAHAVSPIGGVSWEGDQLGLPVVSYVSHDLGSPYLAVDEGERAVLDADRQLGALAVFAIHPGMEMPPQLLTRKIWSEGTPPQPQPEWYPPDAAFDAGAGVWQFYIDPITFRLYYSSNNYTIWNNPADHLSVYCWLARECQYHTAAYGAGAMLAVSGPAAAYAGAGADDTLIGRYIGTMGDFDRTLNIVDGPGRIEWRLATGEDGENARRRQMISLRWITGIGGAATVSSALARTEYQGAAEAIGAAAESYAYPFQLRATKSAGLLTVYGRQNEAAGWTALASATLGGVLEGHSGSLGILADGAEAFALFNSPAPETWYTYGMGTGGEIAELRCQQFNNLPYSRGYGLPAQTAVIAVDNLTTGRAMTAYASGPLRRSNYALFDGQIYFWCEAGSDKIRVTQAAPADWTPGVPGEGPRVFNITNFYTAGSSVPAENLGNWHDELILEAAEDCDLAVGEAFEVERLAVFRATEPPALEYAVRGGEIEEWRPLPEGAALALWEDGLVLISRAFIEGLGGRLCLRALGPAFRASCGPHAAAYEGLRGAIEIKDLLWLPVGAGGAASAGFTGFLQGPSPGPTGMDEHGPTGYCFGLRKGRVWVRCEEWLNHGGQLPPGWAEGYFDLVLRTYFWEEFLGGSAYSEPPPVEEENNLIPDERLAWVRQGGGNPFSYYGCFGYFQPLPFLDWGHTAFSFGGIPFSADLRWLAGVGAVILEARARARARGATKKSWTNVAHIDSAGNNEYWWWANGQLVAHARYENGVQVEYTENEELDCFVPGARLGFSLMAKRRNTGMVYIFKNANWPAGIDAGEWRHYGTGVSADLPSDAWRVIDVTGAIQGALRAAIDDVTDMALWPNVAPDPGAGMETLVSYLDGLKGSCSCQFQRQGTAWSIDLSRSGECVNVEGLDIEGVWVRYRLPSGLVREAALPITLGAQPKI